MKITAQLSGVNRPLSVELRLINFCSCDFDSQEEHDTSTTRGLLAKRSDFRSAQGLVRCSPFGGVEFGKKPGRYGRFVEERERRSRNSKTANEELLKSGDALVMGASDHPDRSSRQRQTVNPCLRLSEDLLRAASSLSPEMEELRRSR